MVTYYYVATTNEHNIDPGLLSAVSSYMFSRIDDAYDFKWGKVTHTNITKSGRPDGVLFSFVTLKDEPGMTLVFMIEYGKANSIFSSYNEAKQFMNRAAESVATKG